MRWCNALDTKPWTAHRHRSPALTEREALMFRPRTGLYPDDTHPAAFLAQSLACPPSSVKAGILVTTRKGSAGVS